MPYIICPPKMDRHSIHPELDREPLKILEEDMAGNRAKMVGLLERLRILGVADSLNKRFITPNGNEITVAITFEGPKKARINRHNGDGTTANYLVIINAEDSNHHSDKKGIEQPDEENIDLAVIRTLVKNIIDEPLINDV